MTILRIELVNLQELVRGVDKPALLRVKGNALQGKECEWKQDRNVSACPVKITFTSRFSAVELQPNPVCQLAHGICTGNCVTVRNMIEGPGTYLQICPVILLSILAFHNWRPEMDGGISRARGITHNHSSILTYTFD